MKSLFGQLLRRFSVRTGLVFIAAILLLRILPLAPYALIGGSVGGDVGSALLSAPLVFLFVALAGGGLDEELGWRGFALPRMQDVMSPLSASIVLGLIWAGWHAPMWLLSDTIHSQSSFVLYAINTTALSVIIGHVYNSTGGSLLAAVLAHAASNTSDSIRYALAQIVPGSEMIIPLQACLCAVMLVAATILVAATKSNRSQNAAARDRSVTH